MAHFYGTIKGMKGEASRLGGKTNGMRTVAASCSGAIVTHLGHNSATEKDTFEVRMESHHGSGDYMVLATGDVGDAMSVKPMGRTVGSTVTDPEVLRVFKASPLGTVAADESAVLAFASALLSHALLHAKA